MRAALWLALWLTGWIPSRLSFSWLQASLLVSVTWRKPVHLYTGGDENIELWLCVCLLCFSPVFGLQGTQPVQTDDPVRDAWQQSNFWLRWLRLLLRIWRLGDTSGWSGQVAIHSASYPPKKSNLSSLFLKCALFDFLTRRCCQVHDACYTDAMQHSECWPILDNPYTEFYAYSCDESSKTVTCGSEYSKMTRSYGGARTISYYLFIFSLGPLVAKGPPEWPLSSLMPLYLLIWDL